MPKLSASPLRAAIFFMTLAIGCLGPGTAWSQLRRGVSEFRLDLTRDELQAAGIRLGYHLANESSGHLQFVSADSGAATVGVELDRGRAAMITLQYGGPPTRNDFTDKLEELRAMLGDPVLDTLQEHSRTTIWQDARTRIQLRGGFMTSEATPFTCQVSDLAYLRGGSLEVPPPPADSSQATQPGARSPKHRRVKSPGHVTPKPGAGK